MIYTHKTLPEENINSELWAFAYNTNNTEKGMSVIAKPYKCKILNYRKYINEWISFKVAKIWRSGKTNNSGRVGECARMYSDNWYEACLGYNKLVDEQINFLQELIKKCEGDKVWKTILN